MKQPKFTDKNVQQLALDMVDACDIGDIIRAEVERIQENILDAGPETFLEEFYLFHDPDDTIDKELEGYEYEEIEEGDRQGEFVEPEEYEYGTEQSDPGKRIDPAWPTDSPPPPPSP